MEKNLEKSLKRFLKRKVKITFGLVISFLITGVVSFAEESIKEADKKEKAKKECIADEELLKNILREISIGNTHIIETGNNIGSKEIKNEILINKGTLDGTLTLNNSIGINLNELNQNIDNFMIDKQMVIVKGGSLSINNGNIKQNSYRNAGQDIHNLGSSSEINIGINNGIIKTPNFYAQSIGDKGIGINNGLISSVKGQAIDNGLGINNGVIDSNAEGQKTLLKYKDNTAINNGIIISDKPYLADSSQGENNNQPFIKNGIALKRENEKLVLNNGESNGEKYNSNINILGKNDLTKENPDNPNEKINKTFSEIIEELKNNSDPNKPKSEFAKNIFINNLGNENDDKDNQLTLDTNLSGEFQNTHIITAVTKNGYTTNEAVIKVSKNPANNNFLMEKSTIIGYFEKEGTLVDMTGVTNITLTDSVISAVGKEGINTVGVKFAGGSDVSLNNSVITGKTEFAEGDNKLNLSSKYNGKNSDTYKDNTQFMTSLGDIIFNGNGNDTIEVNTSSALNKDNINKSGKGFVIVGNVDFGAGDDTFKLDFEDYKSGNFATSGKINFGDGKDKVEFTKSLDMTKYSDINGNITENNENITKNINFLNLLLKDTENLETLQLADVGNTFYFEENGVKLNFNGKILGGTGEDIFVLSFDGLKENKYDFNGGDGIDYIGLTEKYDESKTNLFENLSVKNIEGLKLGNFENEVNIDNLLANNNMPFTYFKGGNQNDKFIISADELKNISINGGENNDTVKLSGTTPVSDSLGYNDFSKVDNVETLELPDINGNKLDINNFVSADGNIKFKNYIGGNNDDSFTVSVENFEKLSLIDGGANETDKGDTLTISDSNETFTNIKNGNIDDTVFDKIQNIETLAFSNYAKAELNLNNLDDNYLQNLEIKLGNSSDKIYISTDKLKNLKGLNGGEYYDDTLQITNKITDRNEDFSFLTKVNSFEKIEFSGANNTINVSEIHNVNGDISSIIGGTENNYFISSLSLVKYGGNQIININGSDKTDTIEITDTLTEKDNDNSWSIRGIEKLVLSADGNNVLVDNLVKYNIYDESFTEVEGTNSGAEGNTFIINGTEADKKDKALGMIIKGGKSKNDTLKVNTEITTEQLSNKTGIENLELGLGKNINYNIDFTNLKDFKNIKLGNGNDSLTVSADSIGSMTINGGGNTADGNDSLKLSGILDNNTQGKENILNGVSNIENLYLDNEVDNKENILNLDNNIKLGAEENGFKNIYGGTGNDTFKISAENLEKLTLLDGGTNTSGTKGDTLQLTSKVDNTEETGNKNLFNGVSNIENLILAGNSTKNNLDLDNLSFKNIYGGNGSDTFKISADKLGNFDKVIGKEGEDTLEIKTALKNSNWEKLGNYTQIEKLKLNVGGNDFILNEKNAAGDNFTTIEFGKNSTGNTITLAENIGAKNIEFETFNGSNTVNVDAKEESGIKTFSHIINNAGKIVLQGDNKVWKFAEEGKIGNSNNTVLDLNENSLEFSEKLSLGADGKLSFGDIGFVSSGKVTLENGKIKVGLSDNVTFDKGTNTKFTLTDENEIAFGSNLNLETYSFLNTSYDNSAKQFNIGVKSWDDLLKDTAGTTEEDILFADTYDYILKEYYNQDKDTDKTITNAFNTFGSNAIAEYIKTVKEYGISKELILLSENGEFKSTVTGTVSVGTDETKTDRNNKLTFNNISAKDFKIDVAEGTDNNISFTGAVTLNNGIKISDTSKGNINISLKENESVNLGDIDFGNKKGTLDIEDTSKIEKIGKITNGDISVGTADTEGFNKILISSNNGVENISVKEKTELEIKNDYNGNLSFEKENNTITLKSNEQETFKEYSGNIVFEKGGNTLTVAENIDVSGKISVNGETNNITVNGTANALIFGQNSNKNTITINGTLESGIDFGESSYGNILTIFENGSVGKDIKFGTGIGDEFKLSSKNGIFNYNIKNADIINLSGTKGEWNFAGGKITGNNVAVNINDNGIIGFNIGKSNTGLVLGKNGTNPFAETGNYIVNGDIKVTFDDTVKFTSLSDTLKATGSNISLGKNYNIIVPEFMKYDSSKKEFAIKSAEELKSAGLKDYAFGNYEHAILNYNKEGYGSLTTLLNNNSLTQISAVLNKGIDEKDYYFYSDDREIKDMATIGDIYIKTSKDNKVTDKDTDIKFTNVTGNTANISFAKDTTNTVSFLEGTNLSKIDGSGSEAGFTLNLNGVNFSNKENEKENETKVTMSNFDDILNINSAIKNISVDTGNGDDTVNILSSINGTFDGNGGNNTLNIGTKLNEKISDENSQKNIILSGEIKNFQSISLNQNTNFDSSLKISGTNEIELNGNNLFLEIDYGKKADEKVIGHALYNNGIKVDNATGKVMIDVAEADDGTIISMGDKNKSEFVNTDKENLIESGSSNHHIEIADGDIVVKINEHIMGNDSTENIKYAHLDKIYQSINSAGKIPLMSETTTLSDKTKEEAVKAQLEFYGKIYHSTPYAYSHEISEKSAELITDSLINSKTMPEFKKWIFGGSIAGQEADSDNNFYGANYYGVDNTKAEADIESSIYGAYAFGEYGIAENQSVGFAVAGTKSDTDISRNSKIKGNSLFVSAYAKQEINNLRMITGLGYQHGFYDSTRTVSNDYQSMSVDKKYEDDLFTIFAGARYSYSLGNNFFLEPNAKLNISHTMQNDINETDNNDLSIEVEEQDFTSVDTEIGFDLVKKINLQKGILNLKLGTSFIYSLEGYEEEYMKAKITGAEKDFEIISPESDRERVRFNIGAEYETEKGMFYNLHGNYITSSNETDYCISFGAGYKF